MSEEKRIARLKDIAARGVALTNRMVPELELLWEVVDAADSLLSAGPLPNVPAADELRKAVAAHKAWCLQQIEEEGI